MKFGKPILAIVLLAAHANIFAGVFIEKEALFVRTIGKPETDSITFSV
jgi:hypothetical protein